MPVALGRNDFALLEGGGGFNATLQKEAVAFVDPNSYRGYDPTVHELIPTDAARYDVIGVHGLAGMVLPLVDDAARGTTYMRPMSGKLFAEYMAQRPVTGPDPWRSPVGVQLPPIKLSICFSAMPGPTLRSVGQYMATALGRDVYGNLGIVPYPTGAKDWTWIRFRP